jgi:hypothetical protein
LYRPTWSKTEYQARFENLWSHAARHLSDADQIIVIGYSLPPSDSFFRDLYALGTVGDVILKRFWVFDPDETGFVERRFKELLGEAAKQRFQYSRVTFTNALHLLNGDVLS